MSGNRWDQPGVSHKGWHCVDVIDLRADGEPADEIDYATCQMCGNEKIRYVHVMEHPDLDKNFEVGCVCAEKMSDDYEGPKRREAKLRNRAVRRTRWLQRTWRRSAKGNSFLNVEGYNLVVYPTKAGRWGYKIGDRFGPRTYPTTNEAKLALFDEFGRRPRMMSGCGLRTEMRTRVQLQMRIELAADLRHLADANSRWELVGLPATRAGFRTFPQEFEAVLRR